MRDTIHAKDGYRILINKNLPAANPHRVLADGERFIMECDLIPYDDYLEEREQNECFELCEIFTTNKGVQYVYWRDNEIDKDYISKVAI